MSETTEPSAIEPWLTDALDRRVHDFTTQLRQTVGTEAVPGLDWDVADLGQHIAGLPDFWHKRHLAKDVFELPDDFAAYSDAARAHITERDPAALADMIESEYANFSSALAEDKGQRWLYGVRTTTTNMHGLALNELILHGRDLAAVTGTTAPMFERNEANAAADAIMVTTPSFVDPDKAAAQPDGVYHVRFRGGNDYTWTKNRSKLSIESGRPSRADARLNADPATFLLAALGRIGQVRAALSGKTIAYGRRPWRFLGLGTIAADGV